MIAFRQIIDHSGVARLAKSARKQILASVKEAKGEALRLKDLAKEQKEKKKKKEEDVHLEIPLATETSTSMIVCRQCSAPNQSGEKFCNQCGVKMSFTCSNCGAIPPMQGAAF